MIKETKERLVKLLNDVSSLLNTTFMCLRCGKHSCTEHKDCISDLNDAANIIAKVRFELKRDM